jgi:glucose/arabinose dehydrogenase
MSVADAVSSRRVAVEALEGRLLMSLPSGFSQTTFATGITAPTAMAFAPDGRLFVLEQDGDIRVVATDGTLLPTPFATVAARNGGEQGLLSLAFAPDFTTSRQLYIHWITGTSQNRISRFTADAGNPNVAAAGSQVDIITLPQDPNFGYNHQGGAIGFGNDGKLYVAIGEHNTPSYAQTLTSPFGKILRLNTNGSIPTDNPFYASSTGWGQAVWALGLRNPYSFAFQPGTGALLVNDVGGGLREEVNLGTAGANYGWPTTEGSFNPGTYPQFTNPVYDYERGVEGCAVIGGTYYNPPAGATNPFPASYTGKYFFTDYCNRFIRTVSPSNGYAAAVFGTDNQLPAEAVDLEVGPDGSLYGLARGTGAAAGAGVVVKVSYTGSNAPVIATNPQSQTITVGQPVTFTVAASGAAPFTYQWQRNGSDISGATGASYTIGAVQASDNAATFRCVVTNASGNATSNSATLTVTSNQAPVAAITTPATGTLFSGGQTVAFAGTGTDPEDGSLGGASFTWSIDLHHDTHTHPFIAPATGQTSGSFVVPTIGETSANIWYRIHLTVADGQGLTHSVFRDVQPRTVSVTLATNPPGLSVDLDGAGRTTPYSFTGVQGITRGLGAPATQVVGGVTYAFVSWSDGGARDHNISTPTTNTTYTATYQVVDTSAPLITTHPPSRGISVGQSTTFTVVASGPGSLSYQWQRNGTAISGATSASYVLNSAALSDNGAAFRCVVTNANGSTTSNAATLTVGTGQTPTGVITAPAAGAVFRGGDVINFSATATDPEDGTLPASAFTWEVLLHHADHAHTIVAPQSGVTGGSFTVPTNGETSADVFYRIHLRVTDSHGLTHDVVRDIQPHTAAVTLASNLPDLQLTLDGQPVPGGTSFVGVSGVTRLLGAPASHTIGGVVYDFVSWSDGGAADHAIVTPEADLTYTAVYEQRGGGSGPDLAPAITGRLPGAVIGGLKGAATVQVRNSGTELLTGLVTVKVFMSSDTVLDGGDQQAGTLTKRMTLRPGTSRPLKLRLVYPAMSDGNYYLLAQVDPDNVFSEGGEANNVAVSSAAIVNHAPVVELSGSFLAAPTQLVRGRRASVGLSVLNEGNVIAAGSLTISLAAAVSTSPLDGLTALGTLTRQVKIRAGGRKVIRLPFLPPAELPSGTYSFTATLDTGNQFQELNEGNNVVIAQGTFTIS